MHAGTGSGGMKVSNDQAMRKTQNGVMSAGMEEQKEIPDEWDRNA
jgi:hypothetical protein